MEIPYINKTSVIKAFLEHIQTAGVPDKVNRDYLNSVGFASSGDRPIVPVLKFIGFLDSSERPTDSWRDYKDKGKAPRVLGKAIVAAYSDLFATFPDAPRKDLEALMNYFRSKTGLSDPTVKAVVGTFKGLCEGAKFEALDEVGPGPKEAPEREKARATHEIMVSGVPALSINIQLQLPATENQEIYDKLFAALRKHLYLEPDREK